MATIKVLNASQVNPEAPVEIKLGIVNEPDKPIQYVGIPGPEGKPGKDGKQGPQGPKGDTPVKGIDYFTPQDIAAIADQVPVPEVDLSDYASKSYVETAIRGAETGLLKRSVVQSLPQSEIDDNTIYMVPNVNSSSGNSYDEYLYIDNAWEHIGSTEVDLTGYATEQWVNNQFLSISNFKIIYSSNNIVMARGISAGDQQFIVDAYNHKLQGYYFIIIGSSGTVYLPRYISGNYLMFNDGRRVDAWGGLKFDNQPPNATTIQTGTWGSEPQSVWSTIRAYNKTDDPFLNSQSTTITDAFRYIKDNYMIADYLTNSDILAIWNGENN